jgi:hypothetical protein
MRSYKGSKFVRSAAVGLLLLTAVVVSVAQTAAPFRPPAVPLVTHDPYFSVWSMSDRLADDRTKHWTGAPHGMVGMAQVDGRAYRLMGQSHNPLPEPMPQTALEVTPTRTVYRFENAGVAITLTFMSPLLPEDLEVMSRPVTYLTWEARSTDGRAHGVALYFDCTAELAVNTADQKVTWGRANVGGLEVLSVGTQQQPVLEKFGDDLRIDWGRLYVAVPPASDASEVIAWNQTARGGFAEKGSLPDTDDLEQPRAAKDQMPALAVLFQLGRINPQTTVSRHLLLAYDDLYSVEYFNRRLRPYWRRAGAGAADLLRAAARDYPAIKERCEKFDAELMADLRAAGGEEYARVAALAFRQTVAAHKLVADWDGTPLFFSKENFSNGSIDTVDVTYPSAPFFLLFNPQLLKAQLRPMLDYGSSARWKFPFAPHDLGTYPLANGQTYGGGEKTEENQMPVEESGNMILLVAALAKAEGDAKFAEHYWPLLSKWAAYLREKGMDPENQLSTDDFAGHLAHNTNLSLKAILALGAYAGLCETLGKKTEASDFRREAKSMAERWVRMADDGDHYRLAFDKPGTWSQKYNLVWDRLLDLRLFPAQVARKELAFYKTKLNPYGLPLDNRERYTKLDWTIWTATLAESSEEFRALVAPVYRFVNESPSRVPLTDWYGTVDGKQTGFQARSVVGGVYVKLLADPALWKKWNARAGR